MRRRCATTLAVIVMFQENKLNGRTQPDSLVDCLDACLALDTRSADFDASGSQQMVGVVGLRSASELRRIVAVCVLSMARCRQKFKLTLPSNVYEEEAKKESTLPRVGLQNKTASLV